MSVQFVDWQFSADFSSAVHARTAEAIRFTRAERALLQVLATHGDRVYPRDALLDAVSGYGSDVSDRSIDFIINRLRRKLGDSARHPRYIQTCYGEGYAWIAECIVERPSSSGAFMVVGPLRGLQFANSRAADGRAFARALARTLDRQTAASEPICLDAECPDPSAFQGHPPRFAVELSFFEGADTGLDCAVALRGFASRNLLHITRIHIAEHGLHAPNAQASALARDLLDELWRWMNYSTAQAPTPDDEPLAIRLHATTEPLCVDREGWQEAERRLRKRLQQAPNDYESQLKLATALHSKYVISGAQLLRDDDPRPKDEAEIEQLVTTALPHIQEHDLFRLMAAKLLYFVNPSHRVFALELAESALGRTTAFASAFATVGQLRMWEGHIDEAVALYDQGLALAVEASHFDLFLRIIKCTALLAANQQRAAAEVATGLFQVEPRTRYTVGLFFEANDEIDLTPDIEALLTATDVRGARGILRLRHYLDARLYRHAAHRQNVMRRPVELLTARFGAACIPEEIKPDLPADLRRAEHHR